MNEHIETVREFWTRNLNGLKFLPSFPTTAEDFGETSKLRYKYHYHLLPLFEKITQVYPKGKLLEIGCGMGDDTAQWIQHGMDVTAIDLTEPAVECTQLRLEKCGLEGTILTGNAESLEFPDNTFDVVYSFGVLHHSPNTPQTIKEVYRVLKPGGMAVIMLYNRKSLNYLAHRILHYPFDGTRTDPCPVEHTYTKQEIFQIFSDFSDCTITIEYLFGTGYGFINTILPNKIHHLLGKKIGWHLMIEAKK